MSVAEYTATFVSILVGLALADLAVSLQRLLRAGRRVRWDVLTPAAALLATGFIVNFWWSLYDSLSRLQDLSIGAFIPDLVTLVFLFLLACSAFPDEVGEGGIDLRAYYEANRRPFWRLFAIYLGWVTVVNSARMLGGADVPLGSVLPNLLVAAAMLVLAWTGRRAAHLGIVGVLLAVTALSWLPQEVRERAEAVPGAPARR